VINKIDLRKKLKAFYSSPKKPNIIDVPPAKFLTITGRGEPGGEAYQKAINALYSVAYTAKFNAKAAGKDFTVMALEGLWWFDDPNASFDSVPREEWNWKSMIRQPEFITEEMVKEAKAQAKAKKGLEEIDKVVLEAFHERLSAQIMSDPRRTAPEKLKTIIRQPISKV